MTSRSRLARWLGCMALVLAVGLCRVVRAQPLDLQLQLSAREVAVGESFQVQLDALSNSDQSPSNPELVAPNTFEMRGPSVGTRQQVSINGFNMVTQNGISASWVLKATRPGVFTIGPASVQLGGQQVRSEAAQIRVLPEGQ